MATYPTDIPDVIEAGITVEFALRGYDNTGTELTAADGYTMYVIFNNSSNLYSATTTADTAQGFLMTIPSSASTGWTAGQYNAAVYVDDGSDRYPVTNKYMEIKPNLLAGSAVDSRSTARKTLEALEARIHGAATDGQLAMSIAGRSIQRMGLEELIKAKRQFEMLVAEEERAQRMIDGKAIHNSVQIRFK